MHDNDIRAIPVRTKAGTRAVEAKWQNAEVVGLNNPGSNIDRRFSDVLQVYDRNQQCCRKLACNKATKTDSQPPKYSFTTLLSIT